MRETAKTFIGNLTAAFSTPAAAAGGTEVAAVTETITGELISVWCYIQSPQNVGEVGYICALADIKWEGNPPGVLTFHETVVVEGQASQTVMRWEDYTQTAMDPGDDCTIWYVGDYVKRGAATYSTRIGSFRLPGC